MSVNCVNTGEALGIWYGHRNDVNTAAGPSSQVGRDLEVNQLIPQWMGM
jgi:hypothetical protein